LLVVVIVKWLYEIGSVIPIVEYLFGMHFFNILYFGDAFAKLDMW
jgi:hypothetical protein